jgi:hypothetical protein
MQMLHCHGKKGGCLVPKIGFTEAWQWKMMKDKTIRQ